MKKEVLRKNILSKRSEFFHTLNHKIYSEKICDKIYQYISSKYSGEKDNIGLYYPISGEVDILSLIYRFPNISLPRIVFSSSKSEIEFAKLKRVEDLVFNEKLKSNKIMEPDIYSERIIPKIILIPGIVFDKNHNRIGYGYGHFDKFISNLENIGYNILKIGICFDFQIMDKIETMPHDKKIDLIITEKRIF